MTRRGRRFVDALHIGAQDCVHPGLISSPLGAGEGLFSDRERFTQRHVHRDSAVGSVVRGRVVVDPSRRNDLSRKSALITGSDCYEQLYSLGELDTRLGGSHQVIVAFLRDDVLMDEGEGMALPTIDDCRVWCSGHVTMAGARLVYWAPAARRASFCRSTLLPAGPTWSAREPPRSSHAVDRSRAPRVARLPPLQIGDGAVDVENL